MIPYTAQPAGDLAGGLRVSQGTSDLCTNERAIGVEHSRVRRRSLSLFAVSVLAQETGLNDLNDLRSRLLDRVHQACE
jgi:hypothetical protein